MQVILVYEVSLLIMLMFLKIQNTINNTMTTTQILKIVQEIDENYFIYELQDDDESVADLRNKFEKGYWKNKNL